MKLIYFAWLKQRTGVAEEEVSPPAEVTDVATLLAWLKSRGPGYAAALRDLSVVRVAVNQEFAPFDRRLENSDEIALFPPLTGG
ncbi:MAG TPA: molybdopterin converting factor subunit 1 [Thermoanaerobaculia bacterium]|nr:molybdopterin converting factor subunit 1 [Thermoanaerobaculia bacterium]